MSRKLDEELAEAAGLEPGNEPKYEPVPNSAPGVAKPIAVPKTARKEPQSHRNLGLLVTLLVMVGILVGILLFGFKEAAIYALPVDDLLASQGKHLNRKVRIDGELVPGTLVKRDRPCEYRFTMRGATRELAVRYPQCVIPDTFRDVPGGGVQVTVEGSLKAPGEFDATLVMAKCTSKYDPKTHEMKQGEDARNTIPVN